MAAGEVTASPRGRKSTTPSGSSSRPSSARPLPPKRAATSAATTVSLRTLTKANALASNTNSATKAKSPLLSPPSASNHPRSVTPKTPSPNYFGLKIEDDASNPPDSDAGKHAKRNWGTYSGGEEGNIPLEDDPLYDNFRRQSEQRNHFKLAHAGLTRFSTDGRVPTMKTFEDRLPNGHAPRLPSSAGGRIQEFTPSLEENDMDLDTSASTADAEHVGDAPSFFDLPKYDSPQQGIPERPELQRNPLSAMASKNKLLSLPHSRVTTPHEQTSNRKQRAETLPSRPDVDAPNLMTPANLRSLLDSTSTDDILLLDLRVSPQYSQAKVKGALNLCIPSTLLKRPAFNVQRLADSFTTPEEKTKFMEWHKFLYIIAYDGSSIQLKDAQSGINTLKKFRDEGYKGSCYILQGGFNAVMNSEPSLIERANGKSKAPAGLKLSLGTKPAGDKGPLGMSVAGGCPMPESNGQAANPFFGNIRQNMDLLDGVGQIPIKRPTQLNGSSLRALPTWLREIADDEEEGKLASQRFLDIERSEQKRMQQAYSTDVQYEAREAHDPMNSLHVPSKVQIAGIEKGEKNRYKDMLPYEHARVKLRHTDSNGCDYINASHVKAQWSHRHYIATQAPVPATFKDFWRLIWEQEVRVIVVLTAQSENGQRKCHPYWEPDTYGHFKVKSISEKRLSLEKPGRANLLDPNRKASVPLSQLAFAKDNSLRFQRRATLMGEGELSAGAHMAGAGPDAQPKEPPFCMIRKLAVTNIDQPFVPLREIVQVEYTNWPDFGAPAEAGELLTLVEQVDNVIRASNTAGKGRRDGEQITSPTLPSGLAHIEDDQSKWPVPPGERPVVVHCSAGCGRTGTFVTVDSVVDMLKRQRLVASRRRNSARSRTGSMTGIVANSSEMNPFGAASASMTVSSPTDSIVSPTSRMEIDSPKKANRVRRQGEFGSIDDHLQNWNDRRKDGGGSDETEESEDDSEDSEMEDEDFDSQDWVMRDDIDLVQKTVEELRVQRLSMVQNLRQFTLCYESVLEWMVREMPERFRKDHFRKSYQG